MTARGNGLRASAYAVLVEIEGSLGDRLLRALAERQIAAYVVPSAGPGGATRLILHVDAQRRVPAGIVLAGLTPAPAGERPTESEPADSSPPTPAARLADDVVFAELIAAFHSTPAERTWPAAEDLPDAPASAPQPPPVVDRPRPAAPSRPAVTSGPRDREEEEDDEDHYSPPPLSRLDPPPPTIRWAFLALGVGIALLLVPTLFALGHRTSLDIAGVMCVLGAAGVLLTRLRERSDDDPDDGAVV